MSEKESELDIREPREGCKFYSVVVEIITEDPDTNKVKKSKFKHLVDAVSPSEVETKVAAYMGLGTKDYEITEIKVDKTVSVF